MQTYVAPNVDSTVEAADALQVCLIPSICQNFTWNPKFWHTYTTNTFFVGALGASSIANADISLHPTATFYYRVILTPQDLVPWVYRT
jgi:hypothetical protein